MKSEIITVTSQGEGMSAALSMTEKLGAESGLDSKPVLHLRLLAEELFGMLRSITGELAAEYWVEEEDKRFELHMKSKREDLTLEMREQFLSASSSGKNEAAKGFMGKIRDMIGILLTPQENDFSGLSLGLMGMGSPGGYRAGNYEWNLRSYIEGIEDKVGEDGEAAEAWDELEKSIVAKIADDVKVGILGSEVELTVFKAF